MKKPPLRVALSKSRFGGRQEETTTHPAFSKPEDPPEDRPERSTPYHLPHGYTEEELDEFIQDNQPEEGEE